MSLLSVQGLTAGYGGKAAAENVSFELEAGEFCALLGLNGSGKTTLLKVICGLMPPMAGRCLICGEDIRKLNERRRARFVSYIPQRPSKLTGVTVLDAVMMGFNARLGLLGFPSADDRAQAVAALGQMGLAGFEGKIFSNLSEGQKQAVILARTLVQDAPVTLMDEPDSALDFTGRHRALGMLRRIMKAENKAGLVTLHDPGLALMYCDRLILLHRGTQADDIRVAGTGAEELDGRLSAVYENIACFEHSGRRLIVYEEKEDGSEPFVT